MPEAEVLVRKLSQLTPLSSAKQATPRYFIMLCGISCMWVSRLCTPAYRGLRVHESQMRPNQTLVSYTLAGLSELSRLSKISLKLPPLVQFEQRLYRWSVQYVCVCAVQYFCPYLQKLFYYCILCLIKQATLSGPTKMITRGKFKLLVILGLFVSLFVMKILYVI